MTDLEGGVVTLKQKQKVWRKYSQEEVFQMDWFYLKGLTVFLLNSGPLKGTILPSSTGLGSFSRADRGIGGVRPVAPPTWLVSNFLVRPASSWGAPWRPGTPSRPRRGIASSVAIRRGEVAQRKRCRDPRCSPRGNPACRGTFGGRRKAVRDRFAFRAEQGTSLETPWRARASSCQEVGTTWFVSSCGGILELRRGIQASSCVGPGKSKFPYELRARAGGWLELLQGKRDLI